MKNRKLFRSVGFIRVSALCGVAILGLAAGCSSSDGTGGGAGVATDVAGGGDGSLTGDSGAGTDATPGLDIVLKDSGSDAEQPGDASGGTDSGAGPINDTGPVDNDIGPVDTGSQTPDIGPEDTGPQTPDVAIDTTVGGNPTFGTDGKSASVQKVTKLAFGAKTEGCDLNGDGKVDNSLSGLSSFAGKPLQDALDKDSLDMLFDPKAYNTSGAPFQFNVLLGDPETGSTCKNPSAGCNYTVKMSSYTNKQCDTTSCESLVAFNTASITGTALAAKADKFIITLSLSGAPLVLTISKPELKGTVADSTSWKTTTNGMLCGYVTDADLNAAIDAAPDATFASIGGKGTVKMLLPSLAPSDIASTPGGPKDAKSLGMKLETVSANITGFSP